jgi:hypothetical protein
LSPLFESVPASEVVVLPNNKNIIPVAEQVDAQTSRTVHVVPTRTVAEGIASLMAYDPQTTAEANAANMAETAAGVVAGEVTQAVRESTSEAGPIAKGDWLGIRPEGICAVQSTMAEAAIELLDAILDRDHELLTIIAGEDADDDSTAQIEAWLDEHHSDVDVEIHDGGQPLYPYYFGAGVGPRVPAGDPPLTLRDLEAIPVSRLRGVGEKKARRSPRQRLPPFWICSPTTRAGTSTEREKHRSVSSGPVTRQLSSERSVARRRDS